MTSSEVIKAVELKFPDKVKTTEQEGLEPFITIDPDLIVEACNFLKLEKDLDFTSMVCISGVDFEENMEVVYHLHSLRHNHFITIKVELPRENPSIPSVSMVWKAADWYEREAFDLFGINFEGHPNLKRILLPDDWEGHPLRKDHEDAEEYRGWTIRKVKDGMG